MQPPVQAILVCLGAEYKAVSRSLKRVSGSTPSVVSLPMGASCTDLKNCQDVHQILKLAPPSVLLMGLCGSLKARYQVGDIVLYQDCVDNSTSLLKPCDSTLTKLLYQRLQERVSIVKGLTSDRIICSATEKRHLGETTGADVVDMEGFAVLEFFTQAGVSVAMLRVVSDDCYHDLPNLTSALSPDGSLQPLLLAMAMLRQPIAATRLIRGSLRGLQVLEQVTTKLFSG
nr:phosphorylase [Iningainema tapete]